MKEIFEIFSCFIPTIILLGLLLIIIDLYFLFRKYLKLKIKYYSERIDEK